MKIVVLDLETLGNLDTTQLEQFGEVTLYPLTPLEKRIERVRDADIIVTNKVVIDREVFKNAPKLKLIQVTATGMNNVDLEEAKRRGVVVQNVAGYSTESVAQQTIGMALNLIQDLCWLDRYSRKSYPHSPLFTKVLDWWELNRKRWGIIGLGTIGRRVAQLAEAFGAEVVYYSTTGKNYNPRYRRVGLEELLTTSQIVSIHAPLTPETEGLIGVRELELMPEGTVLLNLGRGGIVDEEGLAEVLKRKKLLVGLDVFQQEPLPPNHPLLQLPAQIPGRLLLTPHTAWTSREARARLWRGVVEGIRKFLEGVEKGVRDG
ncbi:MAG: D-2-hydroxyacid dehydrogenase [Campylobacterales bacterium]